MLRADQYQGYASGVQALGVTIALAVAAATLYADRRDRKVDRVLELQEELLGSDLYGVRKRIVDHLRAHANGPQRTRRVSLAELKNDPSLNRYSNAADTQFDPRNDVRRLLRFFEKANAARNGGVVDTKEKAG